MYSEDKDKCLQILRSHDVNYYTTEEETKMLSSFFRCHHCDWYAKTLGESVIRYKIVKSDMYGTKCLYLETSTGHFTDIGFKGCRKNIPSNDDYKRQNIAAACRTAINNDIISPKRHELEILIRNGHIVKSEISNNVITDISDLHIDHYDLTFNDIVNRWIDIMGLDTLFSFVNMKEQCSTVTQFTSKEITSEFVNFHNANTHLRVITKEENLKLSKQIR